jgi:Kef-type K+ transport system membrane component KefB/mannitol/fructose-specific phosphotransferase system IIA component (Ntr-type)
MNSLNEPAGIFALIMGIAVVAPYLSDALGIPVVASTTLIGIVLGPQVAGLLEPNILLQFMGSLGMVYVFFSAGAEVNMGVIQKRPKPVLIFGALTFALPFAIGIAFGLALFGQKLLSAVLLGAFFASSGSLAVQSFLRGDIANRESAEVARCGAGLSRVLVAITVFLAGIALPNATVGSVLKTAALWGVYFAGLFFFLPPFASFIIRKTKIQGGIDAVFILFLLFASAWLGSFAGVPDYLGAFYAGLLMAPAFSSSKSAASRIGLLGDSIFLPFLLVFIGASADFSQIPSLPLAAALIVGSAVLGLGSKYLAAVIAAKTLGYTSADRGLLFGFSALFGAFSLAIASVAGSSGLFDQPLVSGAIILVVASSSIAAFAARNSGSSILLRRDPASAGRSPKAGERILVALSKPASAHHLMDLGIALHGHESQTPLFPLSVISEADADDEARQHAETMLAAAIMQGVASQISVIPVSRFEANAAQGILDSAAEQHADTIIVGWNRPPRLANAFFGSVIDQIVNGGGQMVLVTRAIEPFNAPHIIVILPSYCDVHPGFARAAMAVGALSKKNQARVNLVVLKGQGTKLVRAFREAASVLSIQATEIDSWKEIIRELKKLPSAPKLIILFSARPSEPSWHPAIERLPHRLGEEFPNANLAMIYMASPAEAQGSEPVHIDHAAPEREELTVTVPPKPVSPSNILESAINRGTVRVDMKHAAIADGIFELVSSAFPFDRKRSSKLSARLTEIVQRQPIEIEPGVVLIHDRIEGIEAPVVCLGAHRQGFRISLLEQPVKVIIALLVPEKESAEDHLAFLGEIAHLFKERNLTERLVAASKPEDLL